MQDLPGEFVAGKFDKGGSIAIILDVLVTDVVQGQVQQVSMIVHRYRYREACMCTLNMCSKP